MAIHDLTKSGIKEFAVRKRNAGEFYDRGDELLEGYFRSGIDRFCEIAFAFRNCPRVLDVGSGGGLLLGLLRMLGHDVYAVDLIDRSTQSVHVRHRIPLQVCNIEADALPFESEWFDAVSCCQTLEHFTHSHLGPVLEMKRVLKTGGILEIDVPNVAAFRNRVRMLRGKHITWDYRLHYLHTDPIVYKGREYYPDRHNREFTKSELELLLSEAGLKDIEVRFLKSRRYRTGLERIRDLGTSLKDSVPSLRKALIGISRK
ncbi:MAG: class I SAM-dependent methyltransferase [Desulfobacteraceae bacterium]|nr:class I SAM-dependent methyltransferase [Desulfobacteraceae bacterium]